MLLRIHKRYDSLKYMGCRFNMRALIIYMCVGYVHACLSGSVHSKCCSTQTVTIYMCGAFQTPSLQIVFNIHLGMQCVPFHQICKVDHL